MTTDRLIDNINTVIINPLILLLFATAFLYFLWGMTVFIWKADSEDDRKEGKVHMLWGVIGMFVMIAALGIVRLMENMFDLPI